MSVATEKNLIESVPGAAEASLLDRFGQECYRATSASFSPIGHENSLYRPGVDEERIRAGQSRPRWPGGARFAVCLTHDVDNVASLNPQMHWRRIANRAGQLRPAGDARAMRALRASLVGLCRSLNPFSGSDPVCRFERWLEMEAEVGAKSTFLFLPQHYARPHYSDGGYRYADRVRFEGRACSVAEMMREIHDRGWEVGLHASWHACDSADELRRQKEQIETVIDAEVTSVRHHHLHFDIRRTPRLHQEAGLRVDSSLGFNDNIGFRQGTSYPWPLHDFDARGELDVLELPLVVQDKCLIDILGCGNEELALDWAERIIDRVEAVGGLLTLLWHPGTLARPLYENIYRCILQMLREKQAYFGTMREVGQTWLATAQPNIKLTGAGEAA